MRHTWIGKTCLRHAYSLSQTTSCCGWWPLPGMGVSGQRRSAGAEERRRAMGVRGEDRQADGQMGGRTDECHVAASGVASSLSTRQSCADDDDDDNDDAGTTTTLAFALGRGRRGVRLNMWPSRLSTPPHQRPLHLLLCKLQSPRGPIARDS